MENQIDTKWADEVRAWEEDQARQKAEEDRRTQLKLRQQAELYAGIRASLDAVRAREAEDRKRQRNEHDRLFAPRSTHATPWANELHRREAADAVQQSSPTATPDYSYETAMAKAEAKAGSQWDYYESHGNGYLSEK